LSLASRQPRLDLGQPRLDFGQPRLDLDQPSTLTKSYYTSLLPLP